MSPKIPSDFVGGNDDTLVSVPPPDFYEPTAQERHRTVNCLSLSMIAAEDALDRMLSEELSACQSMLYIRLQKNLRRLKRLFRRRRRIFTSLGRCYGVTRLTAETDALALQSWMLSVARYMPGEVP